MTKTLSAAPSILPAIEALSIEQMRERVTAMTNGDLQKLIEELDGARHSPKPALLGNTELVQVLQQRMEEQDVKENVRDAWSTLRKQIGEPGMLPDDAWEKAEKGFLHTLKEKGGVWTWVGEAGLTILSLLGVGSAQKLKQRIKSKGMLRTVVEHAKEHPIFSAFIAALGLKTGSAGYEYVRSNMPTIEAQIHAMATEQGEDTLSVARAVAEKAKGALLQAKDAGLQTLVGGLSSALGGTYDEETGVVTLTNPLLGGQKTLKPPFIVAYQTSVRKNGGGNVQRKAYSLFLIEKRFDALARQASYESALNTQAQSGMALSVERGLALMKNGVQPNSDTPEGRELRQIIDVALRTDPMLKNAPPLQSAPATRMEILRDLQDKKRELQAFFAEKEAPTFHSTADTIRTIAADAEEKMASGNYKGSKETVKKNALSAIEAEIQNYNQINTQKVWLASQLASQMDAASMLEHAQWKMDTSAGGGKMLGGALNSVVESAEKFGVSMVKSGPGKWVARSVTGYSFLPLALEGAAALQGGKEGAKAQQAFMLDAGEAVGGFIPGVGEVLDLKSAFMGTDLNGRELSSTERVIAGSLGALGTASIVAGFFTGGATIVGYRALRGALAARKARKVYKAAKAGIEVSGMSKKTLSALKKGAKARQKLEKMQEITTLQAKARKVQGFIHNAQRTVQIATYAHLGYQVASGMATIASNINGTMESVHSSIGSGIEHIDSFLTQTSSSSPSSV